MASLTDVEVKEIQKAAFELVDKGDYENATGLIQTLLEHDPNDSVALNFLGVIHLGLSNHHLAYQYFRRALQEKPDSAPVWVNFGLSAHELHRNQEAINAYLHSAKCDNEYTKAYVNAAAIFIEESRWKEAEQSCDIALEIDPENDLAKKNLAHVYLAQHKWKEGWEYWEKSLGSKYRKEWSYGTEPRWDGSKGKALIVYGEQGLGDEICYASCIPDVIADSKKVIIDCDPRLEKLFKRSFPKADVHGTRRNPHPDWLKTARIDARAAVASLPSFYRNSEESFPGTPYLKADPELRKMWRGLFDTYGKPVYGLCLRGGSKLTLEKKRDIPVSQLSPLFQKDAVYVSLEYKDDIDHPLIKSFPWATKASEYDLTAALIAELDGVIGIHTTAMHCANGLGVPTHIITPEWYQWRYEGEYVWSKTAKVYHKGKDEAWRDVVRRVALNLPLKDK